MKTYEEITIAEVTKFCKSASLERLNLAHYRICLDIEESKLQMAASKSYIKSCKDTRDDPSKEIEWLDWYSEIYQKQLDCLKEVAKYIQYKHDGYWKLWENEWDVEAWIRYPCPDLLDEDYWNGQAEALLYKRGRAMGYKLKGWRPTS